MPGGRRALGCLRSQLLCRRCQGDGPEPMRTSQRNLHHQLLRSGVNRDGAARVVACAMACTNSRGDIFRRVPSRPISRSNSQISEQGPSIRASSASPKFRSPKSPRASSAGRFRLALHRALTRFFVELADTTRKLVPRFLIARVCVEPIQQLFTTRLFRRRFLLAGSIFSHEPTEAIGVTTRATRFKDRRQRPTGLYGGSARRSLLPREDERCAASATS